MRNLKKLPNGEKEEDIEDSFLSNFLEFNTLDKNDKKYKESLLISYEKTKFSAFQLTKVKSRDSFVGSKNFMNFNDGVSYYNLVISNIRRHLNEIENNELAYLIDEFVQIFELKCLKIINKFRRNETTIKEFEISKLNIIHGLQQFIRVMQETLVIYYNLNDNRNKIFQCCLFTKDNLLNFVISILLDIDRIYDKIFELEQLSDRKFEENYKGNCELLQNFSPEDFFIPLPFCLNEKTIDFFLHDISRKKKDTNKMESKSPDEIKKSIHSNNHKTKSPSPIKNLSLLKKSSEPKLNNKTQNFLKKFSYNNEECNSSKILEKTFYSSSSHEIKNKSLRKNKFKLTQRRTSESFISMKMNNLSSDTNNNFHSFSNSMENFNQISKENEISQYHSISMIKEINNIEKKIENVIIDESYLSGKHFLKKTELENEEEKNNISNEKKRKLDCHAIPYEKAIKLIKNISSVKKPLQKLKKIIEASDSIKNSIKEFYDENQIKNIKNKLLDGDEVLSIFLYVLIKASVKSLRADLKIVENFTTDNILNSKNGYYLMMLQLCIKFIENINSEDLKRKNIVNKKKYILEKVKEWIREIRMNKMMIIDSGKSKNK